MLTILIAAIAPALVLMWYVYHKDTQPEPTRLVAKGFLYGGIAVFASTLISTPLLMMGFFPQNPTTLSECIKISFFGAAIPEECAKLLMLWLLLRACPEFDERYDGIVYASAVGLGFASFENLMYLLQAGMDWVSVSIGRGLFAVPGHFAFAVVMGYYYSLNHFYGEAAPQGTKLKMILFPVLLHGTYDSLVFAANLNEYLSAVLSIALLAFCFWLFKRTRQRILDEADDNDIRGKILRDSAPEDSAPDEQ